MTRSVRFRPAAEADLAEIQDYIARDNPLAARLFVDSLQVRCRVIAAMPSIGRPRYDLMSGLRAITLDDYLVFYGTTDDDVVIERIIHGRRDIDKQF